MVAALAVLVLVDGRLNLLHLLLAERIRRVAKAAGQLRLL